MDEDFLGSLDSLWSDYSSFLLQKNQINFFLQERTGYISSVTVWKETCYRYLRNAGKQSGIVEEISLHKRMKTMYFDAGPWGSGRYEMEEKKLVMLRISAEGIILP